MKRHEFEEFKSDYIVQTFVQQEQFGQWLRKFFYLNQKLNEKYDSIYQGSFYVVFYELITEGLDYANNVLNSIRNGINTKKIKWYNTLIEGLLNLRSEFSEEEIEFIEYKRHGISHIFQNHYEKQIKHGKIKGNRKDQSLDDINEKFKKILMKHGSDKDFDIYLTQKLYKKISIIYDQLKQ